MTAESFLRSYFYFGFVLASLGLALHLIIRLNERFGLLPFLVLRKLSRIAVLVAVISCFLPLKTRLIVPIRSAQIWSGPSMKHFEWSETRKDHVSFLENKQVMEIPFEKTSLCLFFLFLIGFALFCFQLTRSFRQLNRLVKTSLVIKKYGYVEILTSEGITNPLSFVQGRRAIAILPTYLLANSKYFSLALRHELEHLRQRDTRWAYLGLALDAFYFWNPFARLFSLAQETIQEFACDEALLGQKRFSVQSYGGCLLEVAKTMGNRSGPRVGTACSAVERSPSTLKRRIHYMMDSINQEKTTWYIWPVSLFLLLGIVTTSVAFQGTVQDRRVTLERARELATKAQIGSDFPITLNERVLKELNRYIGTPDGREYIRASLERMENYKPMVKAKLADYRLPEELLALPIMESGYQNLPPNAKPYYAAGVWQFVPQTARNFGLVVNSVKDDRLNVEAETDAACRYLGSNYLRFRDWELTILSYNAGESAVQRGIAKYGTRNAWKLIDSGVELDSNYLAKVITSILIFKNPEIAN